MPKGRAVLLTALGVVAALEVYGIVTDADTISAITADCADALPGGRATFVVLLTAAYGWFGWHIWKFGRRAVKTLKEN